MIWEHLDRGVANYDWLSKFLAATIRHLNCYTFDHCLISLVFNPNNETQRWYRRPFRFKEMWLPDSGCNNIMLRAWQVGHEGTPMFKVTKKKKKKLKKCKKMLKSWSKDHFGNVKNQIAKKNESLWKAEEVTAKGGNYDAVITLRRELNILLDKESQMWRQRSRTQWVAKGDKNTKYFHEVATQRKRSNFIKGVRDANGVWQSKEGVVLNIFVDFYRRLFSSSNIHDLD